MDESLLTTLLVRKWQEKNREVGLVVFAHYTGYTKDKETARILDTELKNGRKCSAKFSIEENILVVKIPLPF